MNISVIPPETFHEISANGIPLGSYMFLAKTDDGKKIEICNMGRPNLELEECIKNAFVNEQKITLPVRKDSDDTFLFQ